MCAYVIVVVVYFDLSIVFGQVPTFLKKMNVGNGIYKYRVGCKNSKGLTGVKKCIRLRILNN